MKSLSNEIEDIKDWLIEIRRDFHQYPELGFEEYRTQDKIIAYLNEMGIENEIVAKTGVLAIIKGNKDGKTVALRADIDALPMTDRKEVDYKSKNHGIMHSCGHDAHMTILLGAAKILNNMKDSISGNVKLLFQPAEESVGGARPMILEGVLDNPYVDGIFGLHVDSQAEAGSIGIKYGQMNATSDTIDIIIEGKSSHGAYPQDGIDAIVIAANIINSIQTLVSRNIDPRSSAVVTIGTINGGYARNIIADRIEMQGIVRALDKESREMIIAKLNQIVEDIPRSLGGRGRLIRREGYTSLINHEQMVDIVRENGIDILGIDNIYNLKYPSFGVEDFAFFAEERPAAFFRLATGNSKKGIVHKGHTPEFDIDENALGIGVHMQVMNALKFLDSMK